MCLSRGLDIVVEVVHDQAVSVCWQVDVHLEQKTAEGAGHCLCAGEGEQDIASGIDEVDEEVRCKSRSETLGLYREEQ